MAHAGKGSFGLHHYLKAIVHEGCELITLLGGVVLVAGAAISFINLLLSIISHATGFEIPFLLPMTRIGRKEKTCIESNSIFQVFFCLMITSFI